MNLLKGVLGLMLLYGFQFCQAHDGRPNFVEIKQQTANQFQVQWRLPSTIAEAALPRVLMPDNCLSAAAPQLRLVGNAYLGQQRFDCPTGLSGQLLGMRYPTVNPGISTLFQIDLADGTRHSQLLGPADNHWRVPVVEERWTVAQQYSQLGIRHIWAGVDHLLFVACLIFVAGRARRILITITGFTLAHSLTLVLSTLKWVQLPVAPVEAVIALSILFLASEIAIDNRRSWTFRYPIAVSVLFGLLHGFGFAAVLREIGLPQNELYTALLFFNIGVEIGQVVFVAALALLLVGWRRWGWRAGFASHIRPALFASYGIGTLASFWLLTRLAVFTP